MKFTKEEFYCIDKMLSIILHYQENEISQIRGKPMKETDFDKDAKEVEKCQNNIRFIRKLQSKIEHFKTKKQSKGNNNDA